MRRVIFDLDGVLIRTEHLWRKAYPAAYEELFGVEAPHVDLAALQGQRCTQRSPRRFSPRVDESALPRTWENRPTLQGRS